MTLAVELQCGSTEELLTAGTVSKQSEAADKAASPSSLRQEMDIIQDEKLLEDVQHITSPLVTVDLRASSLLGH
ncbi:hypothetical protein Q5P01_002679 [Channa striata]|uniref:Uncharacterized protein n=1 Tax=Channa striata TaxID=64152 RepID=A0AA88T3Z3_CHASR|nr:hypothetical protein Q5P01_002679 [Channa striata]